MNDRIVRKAFHTRVLKKAHSSSDTYVVDELGLRNGLIRADIAVLNGKLIGYEIKTEKDNLDRLPNQVDAYSQVFDNAFLVVCEKHLNRASELIPEWWGIYIIQTISDKKFIFKCLRKSKLNKQKSSLALAQFLWKSEALEVLNDTGKEFKPNVTKQNLYDEIVAYYDSNSLSQITLQYLKKRTDWRTNRSQLW